MMLKKSENLLCIFIISILSINGIYEKRKQYVQHDANIAFMITYKFCSMVGGILLLNNCVIGIKEEQEKKTTAAEYGIFLF